MMTEQDIERLREVLARLRADADYDPSDDCCTCASDAAEAAYREGVEHVCDKLDTVLRSAETDIVLRRVRA